jgi:hypothetical protein
VQSMVGPDWADHGRASPDGAGSEGGPRGGAAL